MRAVLIDDEYPALDELKYFLMKNAAEVIGAFTDPSKGFEFIEREKPDAVFLDIDMPDINGIELGIRIQEILPGVTIIFVTAYPQYALEAYKAHPLDYIIKPIEEERFSQTMRYIEQNIKSRDLKKSGSAQVLCFGEFTVIGNTPVRFAYQKSRELLAYLICNADRTVYRDELIYALFGAQDMKKAANYLRVTLYRLRSALMSCDIGKGELLIKEDYSIEIKDGICDYINFCRFFNGNKIIDSSNAWEAERIIDLYKGELFINFEELWAEEKRQWVAVRVEELIIKTAAYHLSCKKDKEAERLLLRLIEVNPLSEQGYTLLMDLYINRGDNINFELNYSRYKKVMKELHEPVSKKYSGYYAKKGTHVI
jgi:Response regulator containing CheY-like receiver and SARP domains